MERVCTRSRSHGSTRPGPIRIMLANVPSFSLTTDQPNRPLLWAIQILAILLGAGTVFVARARYRCAR